MTKDLGDAAAEFVNLDEQRSQEYSTAVDAVRDLVKSDGFGYTIDGSADGKMIVILRNSGITYNVGGEAGGFSAGASLATNQRVMNVMSLVDAHNSTIQKRNDRFTELKTSFQNKFNGSKLSIQSVKFTRNDSGYRISGLGRTVDRQFLGRLFDTRIRPIAR
jgi:hypothetical protein